ncbi:hypothetical protein H5410_058872 [Solanum commersonii]|uniref:Uncharacterized protein n=1 Tax=Solanum commersonii TaxID=4109 RepID=A0A9J5W105_SOLCO|nr:hypothetical protein H5410_058872 [Solanum commersonii]
MEPIGPHVKMAHFQSEMIPGEDLIFAIILPGRPLRPYLWSQLALTAKTAHFKIKMILEAGKPPMLLIFMCYSPWIFGRPLRPYLWSQLALTAKTTHFKIKMILEAVHGFFGDLIFRPHFCENFTWTSVKTLPMEPIGPYGQNVPFSRSNDLQSRILPGRSLRSYLWCQLALSTKTSHFQSQTIHGAAKPPFNRFSKSVRILPMELVEPHGQNGPISRLNDPRSRIPTSFLPKYYLDVRSDHTYGASWPSRPKRPIFKVIWNFDPIFPKILPRRPLRHFLWSQLTLTAKMAHFQGNGIFSDPKFRPHFCQNITWTSVRTLPMELVVPLGQKGPFSRSNDPRSR